MNPPNIPSSRATCSWRARLSGRVIGCFFSVASFAVGLLIPVEAQAQSAGTGSIEGRVQNAATGANLNNARVAIKGTNIVTFTDDAGSYQLSGIPGGQTTLRVFFTGLDEQELTVNVVPGQAATQDVGLKPRLIPGTQDGTIKLDAFTVQSTRETNAAAIAVNEQRFANNITSVVSTDEFGTMVDSNPGEFLKYLPGIDVEYFANNITGVSVRGLGANNTEMNFDGMAVASMNAEAVGRGFEVQFATMSDMPARRFGNCRCPRTAPTPSAAPSISSAARHLNTASARCAIKCSCGRTAKN
jgi:hypothetical protein